MKIIRWNDLSEIEKERIVDRGRVELTRAIEAVRSIVDDVKIRGDKALIDYTEKFDGVRLKDLRVSEEEYEEAFSKAEKKLIRAIESAARNIESFHKKQIDVEYRIIEDGIELRRIARPLESVGIYVPGGKAAYPSTLLHAVIPARIAGVENIITCTPPFNGSINPSILIAARILGLKEIYKVGGAQAIAGMAYGTETIRKVDKIIGPGNIYVTAAKELVRGTCDIDFVAGPSEILILAEEGNPKFIASDLLAQAEHDEYACVIACVFDEELAKKIKLETERLLEDLSRKDIITKAMKNAKIIVFDKLKEGINFVNKFAPEHLSLMVKDPEEVLKQIKNAGSIFIGEYSPVAAGDYASGTNHILPTHGMARFTSGISVDDFLKKPTVQKISREGLKKLRETVTVLARTEGLEAHARSVEIRFEE
ncbi:MAG: histidinol dehydrogenase [Candidatus Hydrothermarchaeota archaeon]